LKQLLQIILNVLIIALTISCNKKSIDNFSDTKSVVYEDTVFNNKFLPKGEGFAGSDATYSIVLPDGRTLWIFGDTFLGNVTANNKRIKTTPAYIRNSFVAVSDNGLITYHQGKPEEFRSMMIPPEVSELKTFNELELWYWPGDAFIENGKLNVFASKFFQKDHNDMWAFEFRGTELVEFSLPDLKPLRVNTFNNLDSVHYGHAVLESEKFTYVYGLKKYPYVARAIKDSVRGAWEFYNGIEWVKDSHQSKPMLKFEGSEQFSVFEWQGKYILITQGGNFDKTIYSFTSLTPYGPWDNRQELYVTPLPANCDKCFTYNALAHPQFIEDNYLLISYNTNSMIMQDHYDNALIYRPRFIRVPMDKILD
jgi:hypothetical protein